jgi:hypothetical protein
MAKTDSILPIERIASQIYLIRGQKVMLDSDLAALYGVPTKALNQAVTRNRERFPEDFMFRLTTEEWNRSQSVTGHQTPAFRHPSACEGAGILRTTPGRPRAGERWHGQAIVAATAEKALEALA